MGGGKGVQLQVFYKHSVLCILTSLLWLQENTSTRRPSRMRWRTTACGAGVTAPTTR